MLVKSIAKIVKFGFVAGFVSLMAANVAMAADDVNVEDDKQSYSKSSNEYTKERNEKIDDARELSISKSASDAYYKLPRLEPYKPVELLEEAKGIAVLNGIPLNCKLLGEVEGIDSSDGKGAPSFEEIRAGTLNDLRNKTLDVADARDRVVVVPRKEAMTCELRSKDKLNVFDERDCTTWKKIPEVEGEEGKILFYRIHADVFDCGAR